jgi:hypothetical protein
MTTASIGSGPPTLIDITSGQATSLAAVIAGELAFGEMSAGYGGTGGSLTYEASAEFKLTTITPEELTFALFNNEFAGAGFDSLSLTIDVNGGAVDDAFTFTGLSGLAAAQAFFTLNTPDLGAFGAGSQDVLLSYSLTASEVGAGFGFTYGFGFDSDNGAALYAEAEATPELSTWAMMLLGLCGLSLAGYRHKGVFARARASCF